MQLLNLQPDGDYHRAQADAQATAQVYMTLWDKLINELPFDLLCEITNASQGLGWRGYPAFAAACEERTKRHEKPAPSVVQYVSAVSPVEPLHPQEIPTPLDTEKLTV